MNLIEHDLVIIGGGPAALASAYSAYQNGIEDVLIIERDDRLGGILNQCIHNGFGLTRFKEELTGPEYAYRYEQFIKSTNIKVMLNSMVVSLNENKELLVLSKDEGLLHIKAKAVILAMGCRERTRGAISLPGDRVAGIYTAGAAQKYANIDGYLVGKKVVILGSGDIGLIMARRMTLEGSQVLAVVELCPYSNGLNRNIVQCLNDYNIPLYLKHTVSDIKADNNHCRVSEVTISEVDDNLKIIPGTEIKFECDTLLLSVGLIPENELSKEANVTLDKKTKGPVVYNNLETNIEGIFACGNVLQVHDLVDNVSLESERAGKNAAIYLKKMKAREDDPTIVISNKKVEIIDLEMNENISYLCPQKIRKDFSLDDVDVFFRVRKPIDNCHISILIGDKEIKINKIKLIPSEMEKITLKRDDLVDAKNITIKVEKN